MMGSAMLHPSYELYPNDALRASAHPMALPVGGFPPTETFRPASSRSVPAGTLKRPGRVE
jgi:hypothetical protein